MLNDKIPKQKLQFINNIIVRWFANRFYFINKFLKVKTKHILIIVV